MPMWRCPHCGTPQAETSRCWVCRRSSTACGTCRHFRRSVAAQVGFCGLDRRRTPLQGDEIRACWEPGGVTAATSSPVPVFVPVGALRGDEGSTAVTRRDFVEVRSDDPIVTPAVDPGTEPTFDAEAAPPPAATAVTEPRWSLWADLES
jgi:hypothetical protein